MAEKIPIDGVVAELMESIEKYAENVSKQINEAVNACTNNMHDELVRISPRKTGDYAGGWVNKVSKKNASGRVYGTVYQGGKDHSLTWLLESGHKARNWEMNRRMVRAIPHIIPTQNDARQELDEKIKEILEK